MRKSTLCATIITVCICTVLLFATIYKLSTYGHFTVTPPTPSFKEGETTENADHTDKDEPTEEDEILEITNWSRNTLSSKGALLSSEVNIATPDYLEIPSGFNVILETDKKIKIMVYDRNKTFVGTYISWLNKTELDEFEFNENYLYRFALSYDSGEPVPLDTTLVLTTGEVPQTKKDLLTRYMTGVLDIAYSDLQIVPPNTLETYLTAAKYGFDAAKGDVRITADNKLIMCHDPGFTLDSDGRTILSYNASNYTPIRELTYEQCMALVYKADSTTQGYESSVADFEGFLAICKEYNLIPYVTIRDEYMEDVIPELFRLIRQYGLEDTCIVNSFTISSLEMVRAESSKVVLSYVHPSNKQISISLVDDIDDLDNCLITMFTEPSGKSDEIVDASADAIAYAKNRGIPVFNAQVTSRERYDVLISKGFTGFQIAALFLDYTE